MARFLAVFVFLISVLLLSPAQTSPAAPKTASISGIVIKEPGSEPLKKVLVQVVAENQKEGGNYTASTDADGNFHVDGVEPGRYRIFFERTGFVAVNERGSKADINIFAVKPGQTLENLTFRMLPTAVISGRITDEDGDPMSDVRIVAQMEKPGKMKHELEGATSTNDLGEFRLSGLFPGRYTVAATPPPDFRDYERLAKPAVAADSGDNSAAKHPETRYLTTYYPGTFDAAQASIVVLKAGDDMPVNIALLQSRTYRVRGIITGIGAGEKPIIEMRSKSGDSNRANSVDVGPDGQFEVRGVAPGTYSLMATAGTESHSLFAREDIVVTAGDVEGIKLSPSPSFTMSGHIRVEGASNASITQYAVNLRPAGSPDNSSIYISQDVFGTNAAVDRLGNFEWGNVIRGNYVVQVFGGDRPGGLFLKSAKIGGQDITTGFLAGGPATMDLVVSYNGGSVEGKVVEKEGDADGDHPAANATVVAVPEEKYRNLPDRFAGGATDQYGHFTIRALPPGSYTLYAWEYVDENVYSDPDFLKSQESFGKAIKIEENSRQVLDLKLSPVAANWQ
jgi:protocatechuate 3,4-dioxygenase beta subunit